MTGRAPRSPLRYVEPRPVAIYAQKLLRGAGGLQLRRGGAGPGLLESFIDRIADILEKVNQDLDRVSQTIFAAKDRAGQRCRRRGATCGRSSATLGRNDDLVSTIRESLLSDDAR